MEYWWIGGRGIGELVGLDALGYSRNGGLGGCWIGGLENCWIGG